VATTILTASSDSKPLRTHSKPIPKLSLSAPRCQRLPQTIKFVFVNIFLLPVPSDSGYLLVCQYVVSPETQPQTENPSSSPSPSRSSTSILMHFALRLACALSELSELFHIFLFYFIYIRKYGFLLYFRWWVIYDFITALLWRFRVPPGSWGSESALPAMRCCHRLPQLVNFGLQL